jgi:hypothetical protein
MNNLGYILVYYFFSLLYFSFIFFADKVKKSFFLYLFFCSIITLLLLNRPQGIGLDDFGYSNIINTIETIRNRDFLWYFLVRKISIFDGYQVIILISIIFLIIKFIVIYKVCLRPNLVLFFYYNTFFLIHDFTQFRISAACGLIFISFYFIFVSKKSLGVLSNLTSFTFHSSAILSPLVILFSYSKIFTNNYKIIILISLILLIFKLNLNLSFIFDLISYDSLFYKNFLVYYSEYLKEINFDNYSYPLISIIIALFIIFNDHKIENKFFQKNIYSSLSLAFIFLYIFNFSSVISGRYFEFFIIPIIFIIGNLEDNFKNNFLFLILFLLYFTKIHLVSTLFNDLIL